MKIFITISLLVVLTFNQKATAQAKRAAASAGRSEYIEVEKNVKLHMADLGSDSVYLT